MSGARAIEVAAAVILRGDGSFLLARRPQGKVYAGYWEFPGGKIEPGERAADALARELDEELGIEVERAYPWITRQYTYPHGRVNLRFFRVVAYRGQPRSREDQQLSWQRVEAIDVSPLLPANGPILSALALPAIYAITNAAELGRECLIGRAAMLGAHLFVQVREPTMTSAQLEQFAIEVRDAIRPPGARVLVNADAQIAQRCGLDGVHLKSAQLRALVSRPQVPLVGASCHDAEELALAERLGVDFVVLGPVLSTRSHPGASPLGWEAFERLVHGYPLPVFALGGLLAADLERAWAAGAHGIAMQRGAW